MPITLSKLDAAVAAADALAAKNQQQALSDSDLAQELSVAAKTPKPDRVTYTTCAGVWGAVTAATFRAGLKTAIADGQVLDASEQQKQFSVLADYIDMLLAGPGIDPADPQVATQGAAFVAAGLASQPQIDGVFYVLTYPADDMVAAADVTASRARLARSNAFRTALQRVAAQYNHAINTLEALLADGTSSAPDQAAVLAMLGTAVEG